MVVVLGGGGVACRTIVLVGAALACLGPQLRGGGEEGVGNLNGVADLLTENEGFFRNNKSGGRDEYKRSGGRGKVLLDLAERHSLWGHMVWNAGRATARHIEANRGLVEGKYVVELGAGAGLPSMVAALEGAALVCATDYPDEDLLAALERNAALNGVSRSVAVRGFKWGSDLGPLLALTAGGRGYDLVLLCDVVFNHMCHRALLVSCRGLLVGGGEVLVSFSHHRPSLADKDLDFLRMAREEFGFRVELCEEFSMDAMRYNDEDRVRQGDGGVAGEPSRVVWMYRMFGGAADGRAV